MSEDWVIVEPESRPRERFDTCDVDHRKLTAALGCTELRVNQIVLEPGDVTTPHRQERQEEVFVAMTGGRIAIDGECHDVSAGTVVRVPPDSLRSHRNDTDDETHVWLAFGAPPVGTVEDFGEYVVPDGPNDGEGE